ncbi:Rhodopsin orphan GPCR [Fasciola hepatica]|uniref:Rhodopsin orphan GPCR n=1 Tax=Fasciola hepatica TaxID=6192 RepID=A0A4E0S4C0_FASHE|nr:Rhodopsin orphan GPCR [Fasciola hepatica]
METNQSLQFAFQFYHHVEYLGECTLVNDSRMFGLEPAMPTLYGELAGICLALISLIFNGLSLIVFCVDECGGLQPRRTSPDSVSTAEKNTRSVTVLTSDKQTVSLGLSKKSTGAGAKRSSVTLSLLLLCVCECTYGFGKFIYRVSIFTFPVAVSSTINSLDALEWMKLRIQILPAIQNLFFFISDVGLLCRNWCVCLITIARAEVVMWPLGSRRWQRFLRTRRLFLWTFLVILFLAVCMAYVKHADFVGLLCFDREQMKFALWMQEFIMTQDRFVSFELFGYHMLQSCLVWLLIFFFTLIIIIRLKPWKQDVDKLFSTLQDSSAHHSLKSDHLLAQSVGAQADAIRRRQQSQLRATRVVVVIVVLFLVLEFAAFLGIAAQYAGLIHAHSASMRTFESVANTMISTDSIANFIVFILTLRQFRLMCLQLFCCRKAPVTTTTSMAMRLPGQGSSGSNGTATSVVTVTERTQIELE